ncbi:hypothetical protein HPP92_025785 [Vanilla planifolia]|uniref:Homeobox domain-containing protein n=1 Tax=Vanilla planifolia TaxID=51239 RepID=A0A835PHF9_VANPL|nr:hypothetical protein HPP92_026078 [Vanilla planifolia]KAG0452236.1 hypothetical protein HPP92_025785 [Vanilla planifolia]
MKKAKLLHMFEDLEKRYKLYHNQMQTVANSFEAAAGIGAARTYTALALQTISKQFRCLRDAISGQIREASKRLGEEDRLGGDKFSSSRLSLIGHQIRQQRALQQIAIMQQSAWRPQRGLPERSVSILRAWLFEHFLHPYPKDSDKQMLAKQTGLTRSQVSNWFINARVRLWKPMVEEMYLEEAKEGPEQSSGEEKSSNAGISPPETEQTTLQLPPIGSPRQATILNGTQALEQSNSMEIASGDVGFGTYASAEQFGARGLGYGVSLTLGLPHSENLSLSRGHPTFRSRDGVSLGRRVDIGNGNNEPSVALNPITFQGVDVQSKRLAAQLLRDFVA